MSLISAFFFLTSVIFVIYVMFVTSMIFVVSVMLMLGELLCFLFFFATYLRPVASLLFVSSVTFCDVYNLVIPVSSVICVIFVISWIA